MLKRPTTIAAIVALGLALTGVALGLLYIDARGWQRAARREQLAENRIADSDDLPNEHNMPRMVAALVCGSVGVGSSGFGGVLLLCRARLFGAGTSEEVTGPGSRAPPAR